MILDIGFEFFHPKKLEWKCPKKFYMSQRTRQRYTTSSDARGIFQLWWGKGKLQLTWRRT